MTFMNQYLLSDLAFTVGSFAIEAMLYEVSCFPSPGLVSPVSTGAHTDMNFYTFIDSTTALNKYFILFAQAGMSDLSPKEIFNNIRGLGIDAEKEMFAKTNGINTHKGMLFLIGISCAAVGKALFEKRDFSEIQGIIQEMTTGIVQNELISLKRDENLSHGERNYLKYKNKGIRGEVEAGIPTVFDSSLELYRQGNDLSKNDRLIHTLIGIMQTCDDSTIVHRHSPEVLVEVQTKAKDIMDLGGMKTEVGRDMIAKLCEEFIDKNISPGGSADLLGVTVFFHLVEAYMVNKKTT